MTLLDDDRLRAYLDAGIDPVGLDEILARVSGGEAEEAGEPGVEVPAVEPSMSDHTGRWLFRAAAVPGRSPSS